MSCTADAWMLAIERAFPGLDNDDREAVFAAMMEGRCTDEQRAAVQAEFDKLDHLDVRNYSESCSACQQAVLARIKAGRPLPAGVPYPPLVSVGQGDSRRDLKPGESLMEM
jgi:hypothetical protein